MSGHRSRPAVRQHDCRALPHRAPVGDEGRPFHVEPQSGPIHIDLHPAQSVWTSGAWREAMVGPSCRDVVMLDLAAPVAAARDVEVLAPLGSGPWPPTVLPRVPELL